jgi:invasion protein IalB
MAGLEFIACHTKYSRSTTPLRHIRKGQKIYKGISMSLFLNKFTVNRKIILVLGLFFLSLPLGSLSAQTQGGEGEVKVFKDWFLKCAAAQDGAQRCVLFQDLVDPDSQQPIMQLAVGFWGGGNDVLRGIIVTVPTDVALRTGIHLQVDGADIGSAPFFSCAPNGCQARIPLQEELLQRLKAGNSGRMTYRKANGSEFPVLFSLRGFTAGFAEVR